ncbi:MAG TPA: EAL domain-containing protein [Steroidobacteraceae bacterium]|nr:EAL domain-containing protein [Steroidobacteraceae bacterium]
MTAAPMDDPESNADLAPTVLIVDDDPGARLLLGTALEMAGFRVSTAADGLGALSALRARPVDCIILDVVMPGMNGFDTCVALRALPNCDHVPVLMQTSLEDMESVNRAYTAGATDFSSKGINPMLLAQRVKFLVRTKRTQDQLRASEARVRYLAYYDTLTGLPNRQRLRQILGEQVEWAARHRSGVGVLILDIDNFSRINDTQGPAAGDVLLREVVSRLTHCLRDCTRAAAPEGGAAAAGDSAVQESAVKDCVARTGGDEFAMALPGVATADAAEVVARRVQLELARPFIIADHEAPMSAAIGISIYPLDASGAEGLISNADAAMHHAKRAHQGGMEFFKQSISTRAAKRMSLEADLRKAMERREFMLNYQPRLSLEDLQVEAVEALLRWPHPLRGLVPPDEFIPIAEQSGLIVEIGEWVLREACAQVKRWQDLGITPWQVAVNVSGVQFRDGTLVRRVENAVASAGIDPGMIELEFTEGALIEYSTAVSKAVRSLKELGVATALDDFGTGYSSMSYLRHFPVDTLKIDRVFVRDIASKSAGNAPLVDAIIAMAKSLGLATVAEGVETEAQWQYLKERRANQVQGYLFCKPLPIGELERWHTDWLLSREERGAGARGAGAA